MRTVFAFISLIFIVNANGQNGKNFQSHWRDVNTNITGMADDSFEFFKRGNFLYYISNDRDNIYIDIKFKDSGVQHKILQEGLTVWVNANGKLHKETGIRYPLGAKYAKGPGTRSPVSSGSPSPLSLANTIQLIGFQGPDPNLIPAKNTDNFSGSIAYDNNGALFYNLRMPVSKLSLTGSVSRTGFEPFSIGIEYGGVPDIGSKPAGQAPPPPVQGIPSGGSRGGPGGRSSGGGGRGGPPGAEMGGPSAAKSSQEVEVSRLVWVKNVSLAGQP